MRERQIHRDCRFIPDDVSDDIRNGVGNSKGIFVCWFIISGRKVFLSVVHSRVTRAFFPSRNRNFPRRRTPSAHYCFFFGIFFLCFKEKSTTICSCYLILYLVLVVFSYKPVCRVFVRKYTVSVQMRNRAYETPFLSGFRKVTPHTAVCS